MWLLFSLGSPSLEWSATLIGIGLLLGVSFGFWLGTYLTVAKDPEGMVSLAESYEPPFPRQGRTLSREENLARQQLGLATYPEE